MQWTNPLHSIPLPSNGGIGVGLTIHKLNQILSFLLNNNQSKSNDINNLFVFYNFRVSQSNLLFYSAIKLLKIFEIMDNSSNASDFVVEDNLDDGSSFAEVSSIEADMDMSKIMEKMQMMEV